MQVQGVSAANPEQSTKTFKLWDGELPSFKDIVDTLNPLQHIPIVSSLYQNASGDKMGAVASVGGATILGGLVGGAIAIANEVVEAITGNSVEDHVLSALTPPANNEVNIAALEPLSGNSTATPKIAITTKDWIYGNFPTSQFL